MAVVLQAVSTIHDGFYTVVSDDKHFTYRVHTQPKDADFAPGKQVIGFLRGGDNTRDYTGFAFIVNGRLSVWKRFQTGKYGAIETARFLVEHQESQELAGKMYAMESGNCYRCNRLLTDPVSIKLGIGPTCRNK